MADVSHVACRSSGQVFASCNAYQSSRFYRFANSRRIGREEVTARLQSHTRCRSFGNWYSAQRGGEGLRVRNNWPLSGQCCIVSNFGQQVPRSRSSRNIKVRCEGESAYDTVTYREGGEALGQGGGDGAERESVLPIALENSLTNNSTVDDEYQKLRVSEGLFEIKLHSSNLRLSMLEMP